MSDPSLFWVELAKLQGQLAAVFICWVVVAFGSLSEAALVRMEVGRARQLAEERGWTARQLLALVEGRQEVLSTLILLINTSVIVASAYTTEIAIKLSGDGTKQIAWISFAMIIFILTFCEVAPKTYGFRRAEAVGLVLAPVLTLTHKLVRPVGRLLHLMAIALIRRVVAPIFGGEVVAGLPQYTDEEVLEMMVEGEEGGGIEEEEREMIAGVIEFAEKVAREVMTPRTDIVWVSAEASLVEAVQISERSGHTRLPVCEEDVDHVVGILYMKDVVSALVEGGPELTTGAIARKPAPMIPESKKVDEVLQLMQRRHLHMAIVIDEYGGTAGLVTIEDLLEEIFGEIRDEHDFEAEPFNPIDENAAVVDARVSVGDFEDHFEVTLPQGEFDSVGGFMLDRLGHLPAVGESVAWRNLEFTVEAVSENRIQRVRVVRHPEEAYGEGEEEEAG
jgi:CBS domain containing-hemolysin-like protein